MIGHLKGVCVPWSDKFGDLEAKTLDPKELIVVDVFEC